MAAPTINSQRLTIIPVPFDSKRINCYINGSNVVIETIAEYLTRVSDTIRDNTPVTMLIPKIGHSAGSFPLATFSATLANFNTKTYAFIEGFDDSDFTDITGITDISGQDLSTADNSTSAFITLGDIPAETDPDFNAWLIATPPAYPEDIPDKPIQVTGLTLLDTGWTLDSGLYYYDLANVNITANSIVEVIPDNADVAIIKAAEVLPSTLSSLGNVRIWSTNEPTADIGVTINITEKAI